MSRTPCPDCSEILSRRDVMLRHRRNKHTDTKIVQAYPQSIEAYPPPPPPPQEVVKANPQSNEEYPPPPPPQEVLRPPLPSPPQNNEIPPPQCKIPSQEQADLAKPTMVLQHPFTMIVAGPTGECIFYVNLTTKTNSIKLTSKYEINVLI